MNEMPEFKSLAATIKALETDNPNGEFEAILSTSTPDREGESIAAGAFDPLPASMPLYVQHDWMEKALPIGRGVPSYVGDMLTIKGTFASTPRAQEVRSLVNEGVIDSMSVGFLNGKRKSIGGQKTVTKGEAFEASFTGVPVNPTATVLASKALAGVKAGARNSSTDQGYIQQAHDSLVSAGADCAGAKSVQQASVKAIAGSYEDRQEDITEALVAANTAALVALYPNTDPGDVGWRVNIIATFDDHVVYRLGWDDDDGWTVTYTWDGETATLGTPEAVSIDQVVTPTTDAPEPPAAAAGSAAKAMEAEQAQQFEARERFLRHLASAVA